MREPDRALFEDLSVAVSDGDRLGIVGINGTGKSTLLRVMAGLVTPDRGEIRRGRGMRTSFLGQAPVLSGSTVREAIGDNEAAGRDPVVEAFQSVYRPVLGGVQTE